MSVINSIDSHNQCFELHQNTVWKEKTLFTVTSSTPFETIETFLLTKKKMATTKYNRMKKLREIKIKTPKKIECARSWKEYCEENTKWRWQKEEAFRGNDIKTNRMRVTIKWRKKRLSEITCVLRWFMVLNGIWGSFMFKIRSHHFWAHRFSMCTKYQISFSLISHSICTV